MKLYLGEEPSMKQTFSLFIALLLLTHPASKAEEPSLITSDDSYQKSNKEFELLLKAAQDVGVKECKSDAPQGELARSALLWFSKGKLLSDGERVRFNIYQSEIAKIKNRMQELLDSKDSARIQSEGFLLQAELINTDISFLWGTRGRIEARTNFWVEIKNAAAAAKYEDKLWLDSFDKDLIAGLNQALDVAKDACEAEEKVEGCEDAQSQIQKVIDLTGAYKEKYSQKDLPSKKIYDDLIAEEEKLKEAVEAISGGAQNYDWKTPAVNALEKVIEVRKKVAVYCPESKGSKSQEKAVKIAEIFEDKTKSDEEKKTEMRKVDESLANSLIGGGLSIEDLKKIPEEWNRQNRMIGLGALREPLVSDITKRIEALIAQDKKKYEAIKEKRAKIYKIILAMGDMSKNKLDLNAECGSDPHPGTYVCPGLVANPMCDPNSSEHYNKVNYNACKYRVDQQNDMISQLAKSSDALRSNPNVVGVEAHYLGTVGPIWRAIIKNPDGTISYENVIKQASQYGADYSGSFAGVQNDPRYAKPNNGTSTNPTPSQPSPSNSSSSGSGSSSGSSGSGSGSSSSPSTPASNSTTAQTAGISETTKAENKKIYDEVTAQILKKNPKSNASAATFCGSNPCVKTKDNKTCQVTDENKERLNRYNQCVSAVNDHNGRLDASINLSIYIKNNPDFVGVEKSPDTKLWMAKMKKTNGEFYYLPLNYNP